MTFHAAVARGRMIAVALVATGLAALLIAAGAHAAPEPVAIAAPAPVPAATDIGPLVSEAVQIMTPIVMAVGTALGAWVLQRLGAWLGLKQDEKQRQAAEQALQSGLGYAMSRLGDRAAGGIPIQDRVQAVAIAGAYAREHFPDAFAYFKKGAADVARMVEARLEGVLVDPENERSEPPAASRRSAAAAG